MVCGEEGSRVQENEQKGIEETRDTAQNFNRNCQALVGNNMSGYIYIYNIYICSAFSFSYYFNSIVWSYWAGKMLLTKAETLNVGTAIGRG